MSVNASSDASHAPSVILYSFLLNCLNSTAGIFNINTFIITDVLLLLPLYVLVLHLGLQHLRSRATMCHADVFTCHMAVAELLNVFGSILICWGLHADVLQMMGLGIYLCIFNLMGQLFFHVVTCVERYLAVIHPITYLSLRNTKGIRFRNVTIGCAWLISFAGTGILYMENETSSSIFSVCIILSIFTVISFCSLSVLCVLIRPGPGEGGGDRRQVDQSKLRAFYTITAILGALMLRLVGNIVQVTVYFSSQLEESAKCAVWFSVIWFGLPSSLVLPLLFLHRAGKLLCCKNSSESGQGSG